MKKTTLTLLFALVLILSVSVMNVFAASEEEVLTVFNDLSVMYPELSSGDNMPVVSSPIELSGSSAEDESVMKAPIDFNAPIGYPGSVEGKFNTCGDGTIDLDIRINRMDPDDAAAAGIYYGPNNITYIRKIVADVTVNGTTYTDLSLKDCKSTGGDSCHAVYFNSKGEARISGYVQLPVVIPAGTNAINVTVRIDHSTYMTVLWPVDKQPEVQIAGIAEAQKYDYCETNLETVAMGNIPAVRGAWDENSHEGRIQVNVANKMSTAPKYNRDKIIPGEIWVAGNAYSDYTCRYTTFNTFDGAPMTDYCKYGEAIPLKNNALVRFDIEFDMDNLDFSTEGDLPFSFRVGGMGKMVDGILAPVECPSEPVSKISAYDPTAPFLTFYEQDGDDPIEPSGAYGVYEGAVVGMYEKCGRKGTLMIRLKNSGAKDEVINLDNIAVAINGGTPMKFVWVAGTEGVGRDHKIYLYAGDEVTLIGMAKITDSPAQLNSDAEMTAAVNLLDYGMYLSGKLYSDHNNTKCVAP